MTERSQEKPVWETAWPDEGLEYLGACPICESQSRSMLHENLIDNTFFTAPGKWTMWCCGDCGSGYLDPRPNKETINLAYSNYYTHKTNSGKAYYGSLNFLRKLRRRLVNGYTNWRFGTQDLPASALGVLVANILPSMKKKLDREYRYLPELPKDRGVLLDVGCGDGSFLKLAQTCGWEVVGIDPDSSAVGNARKHGLVVYQGTIEYFDGQTGIFDVITLNHVIEHLHEPIKVLNSCYNLLKPGGLLWMETPNINSTSLKSFGSNWRGLEPPRHLVIFNRQSLVYAIKSVGFSNFTIQSANPQSALSLAKASKAISIGVGVNGNITLSLQEKFEFWVNRAKQAIFTSRNDLVTISAKKQSEIK